MPPEHINLITHLKAILFVAGRSVKLAELAKACGCTTAVAKVALGELQAKWRDSGIVLIEKDEKYQLVSSPNASETVSNFLKTELREKLTDAALETLAIIAYKQPVARAEIEAIRGVNSQYILRQLSIRGMIEKIPATDDSRRLLYRTTLEFMASLGITDMKQLPDFETLTKAVSIPETPGHSTPNAPSSDRSGENKLN